MPSSKEVYNLNVLVPTGFEFGINRCPNLNWFVQEVNVPGITLGDSSKMYSTGKTSIPGDTIEYNELTLTFQVDESLNNWREIYNWMRALAPSKIKEANQYSDLKKSDLGVVSDGVLILMTNSVNPNITIEFKDLFPLSLSDISMSTIGSSIDPITSTVTFRYSYYNISVNDNYNDKFVPGNKI